MPVSNRRWIVCAGCTLLLFCTVGLAANGFSVFQPYLIRLGLLGDAEASSLGTIRTLFGLLSILSLQRYLHFFGLRRGLRLAAGCCAASYFLYSAANSYPLFCLAAALAGIGYGFGGLTAASILIHRWFDTHLATAIGICFSGSGAALILAPPLLTLLIERRGLSAAFFDCGVFVAAVLLLLLAVIKEPPHKTRQTSLPTEPSLKRGSLLISKKDYCTLIFACAFLGVDANCAFGHLGVLLTGVGFDSFSVSWLISLLGIALMAGKLLYGILTDHIGTRRSNYVFFTLLMIGCVGCCIAKKCSFAQISILMLCYGFGLSLASVGVSVFAHDVSSEERYDHTARIFQIAYLFGSVLFSSMPGVLAKITGSYLPAYLIFAALSFLCAGFVFRIYHLLGRNGTTRAFCEATQPEKAPEYKG